MLHRLPLVFALLAVAACKSTPDGQRAPSYGDIQRIFDESCAGAACHISTMGGSPASIDLSAGASYGNLVGQASTAVPAMSRVMPGDPQASYLYCVVDPACTALASGAMPPAGPLAPESIEAIRRWIAAGAARDGSADAGVAPDGDTAAPVFGGITSAVATSETAVAIGWAAAVDVTPPSRITYRVYAATVPGGEDFSVPVATVTGVETAVVTNLQAGIPYYFVARATDEAGNTDTNTVERTATTLDTTPPSFAGAQAAAPAGAGAIAVAWNAATDNASPASAIRYRVYVATAPGAEDFTTPTLTTAAGATGATVSGLGARTYYVVVRAVDAAGNEDANTVERSAAPADTMAPAFAGLASATPGPQSVTLAWSAATDNVTPQAQIEYLVYEASTPGGESYAAPSYVTPAGATSYAVGGLAPSTTYYFVVRARDQAGNIDTNTIEHAATTPSTTDTMPPAFAGAQAATATSAGAITLSWTAATDNVTPAASITYLVYEATASGGESYATPTYTTLAGATSYAVTGLAPGTTYYFVVRARDQAGNVDTNTVQVSATTAADTTPPMFAGLSSATATGANAISLAWTAATDDVTPSSQLVYLVYQSKTPGGENFAAPTYTTAAGATSFAASGLASSTTYYYVVRARDAAGNIDTNTVEKSATTAADTTAPMFAGASSATPASPSSITLAWTAATDNSTPQAQIVYLVYQATTPGGESFATPTYTTAPGATSFAVTGLAASTAYYFVVRAEDTSGNIDGNTVQVSATTLADSTPPTFAGLTSASAASATSVALAWTAATDDVTPSSQITYLVYDATTSGGESFATPVLTTAAGATSATVTGLATSTTYYFVVRARDQAGNVDANTIEKSATTQAATVSFASSVQPIFTSNCALNGCHTGVAPAQGLNLSSGKSYAALVNVLSTECTSDYRVLPNASSSSYLMWKLQGSGTCFTGTQMPKGGSPLSAADQATIASWIDEGAPNN